MALFFLVYLNFLFLVAYGAYSNRLFVSTCMVKFGVSLQVASGILFTTLTTAEVIDHLRFGCHGQIILWTQALVSW